MDEHRQSIDRWMAAHRQLVVRCLIGVAGIILALQLVYPGDKLLPFASVDGVSVSGWNKTDAVKLLDERSAAQPIAVSLGKAGDSYDTPKPGDIGLKVSHGQRIDQAAYPWYLRVIPTSLLWFGLLQGETAPAYTFDESAAKDYLTATIGKGCVIPATDASLRLESDRLVVVPAKSGGACQEDQAVATLAKLRPRLNQPAQVTIPVTVIAPNVGDDQAKQLGDKLNQNSRGGIKLQVADVRQTIEQREVLSWLTFKAEDGIGFGIDAQKANAYLAETATPKVTKPAGVTKVSTLDFTETSRSDGVAGQTLALDTTLADITRVLDGNKREAAVSVTPLVPKVEYSRSYTKTSTGIAAQIQHYDDDNAGVFGVSFTELGGQGLSAEYNAGRQFVTASTYKLFVAFSTIKRVEAGHMKWDDANIASGRDLAKCFDDMIVKSDNACAEALIKKIGAKDLNADIKSLGLGNTGFRADDNLTTAGDLANYLTQLEKGTMPIKPENRERLLGAMKRSVYRQGVPAGASGQVADKVGFLEGLIHDATIVYSPKGTYVLVVLTDGSSWAKIADLTRKIEALR